MIRRTYERYLIDGDDRQTERGWCFEVDGDFLTIRARRDGSHVLLIRVSDIGQFRRDLNEVEHAAAREAKPTLVTAPDAELGPKE